jgi:hypothetical protein
MSTNQGPFFKPRPAHLWTFRGTAASQTSEPDGGSSPKVAATISQATMRHDNSVELTGADASYVDFGPDVSKFGIDDFTVTFWMKSAQSPSTTTRYDVIGNRVAPAHGNFFCVRLGVATTAQPRGSIYMEVDQDNGGTNYLYVGDTGPSFIDGNWHFYTFVREENVIRLYIDGVNKLDKTGGGIANISSDNPFKLGKTVLGGITGRFTDVTIYYAALTDIPIQNLYNTEKNYTRD